MTPTQAERTESTRAALVDAGRRLFGRDGFAAASIEELAHEAGVTRGALYHHFESKEALFEATFEAVEIELMSHAGRAASKAPDAWRSLIIGARAFLEAASDAEVLRIVMIDGPSVLGWQRWREIEEKYALGGLRASLNAAAAAGFLRGHDTETLAHVLLGALTEATMVVASGARPAKQVYREVEAVLEALRSG